MRIGSVRVRVEWGHLAFVGAAAAFCVWYWLDARSASTSVQNLLLIQPAAVLALILCVAIAPGAVHIERDAPRGSEARAGSFDVREWRGVIVAGLLALYVAAVLHAGFDLATFVFLAAAMYVLGERRWLYLIGYSAVFALAMSYAFKVMLSVPVPTLLF